MGRRPSFPFCSHSANTQLHNFAWLYTENASVEVSLVFLPSKSYLIYLLEMWQDIQLEWHFERAWKKTLACSKCDQSITDRCDLKIMTGLTLEKPFACYKCDKAFSCSGTFKEHEGLNLPVPNVTSHLQIVVIWKSWKDPHRREAICLSKMWQDIQL